MAEILVLLGAYQANAWLTGIATTGFVAATIYSLWIMQKAFMGRAIREYHLPDLSVRYMTIFGVMILMLVWLGLYPKPVIETAQTSIEHLQKIAGGASAAAAAPGQTKGGER